MRNSLTYESYSKLLCLSTRSTHARACSQEIRRHSSVQSHKRAPLNTSLPWATALDNYPQSCVLHPTSAVLQTIKINKTRHWNSASEEVANWQAKMGPACGSKLCHWGSEAIYPPCTCMLSSSSHWGQRCPSNSCKSQRICCRGKAKAKIHTQVALQELIFYLSAV